MPDLWTPTDDGDDGYACTPLGEPLWLTAAGPSSAAPPESDPCVLVSGTREVEDIIAVALVPLACSRFTHNLVPVSPGLLALRHADRFDVGQRAYWVAVRCQAELTQYAPGRHPPDVYCFLSKARLRDGEQIAVCPGVPGVTCGTIYRLSSWEAIQTQRGFKCANCGFDPKQPGWRPPPQRTTRTLESLLALLDKGGQ